MNRQELSRLSGVSARAIQSYEQGDSVLIRNNLEAIRQTFDQANVEFYGQTGVRMKNDGYGQPEPSSAQ